MKKELDKELYPDLCTRNLHRIRVNHFREPIAKLGKKITDRIPQKLGLKRSPEMIRVLGTGRSAY